MIDDLRDDLLYRCARRLVRLLELKAPNVIIENDIKSIAQFWEDRGSPEYEQLCLEKAQDRDLVKLKRR